jgi:multicomponent Na+:H+ antiporter subunit E
MQRFALFIISFIFWLLLTWSAETGSLVTGLAVAGLTALFFGRYFFHNAGKLIHPHRYYWFIIYLFIFIWECIKANFDVAYRVLHPEMPIKPGIVKVPLKIKSPFARTMLANSITMTPGTITVDIVDDNIYVHWIYIVSGDPVEYTKKVSGRFEHYIKKIFE